MFSDCDDKYVSLTMSPSQGNLQKSVGKNANICREKKMKKIGLGGVVDSMDGFWALAQIPEALIRDSSGNAGLYCNMLMNRDFSIMDQADLERTIREGVLGSLNPDSEDFIGNSGIWMSQFIMVFSFGRLRTFLDTIVRDHIA